jgi:acyl-CoA synthetase (AMP-forming)/AMP-acid ligase II
MGTLILRRKFSANSFWEDIATHKYVSTLGFQRHHNIIVWLCVCGVCVVCVCVCVVRATVFQYIGELCRYLLSHPPKPSDSQHQYERSSPPTQLRVTAPHHTTPRAVVSANPLLSACVRQAASGNRQRPPPRHLGRVPEAL